MDSVKEEKKARKRAKRKDHQAGICSIATPLIVVYAEGHSLKQARKTAFDAVKQFADRSPPNRKEVN